MSNRHPMSEEQYELIDETGNISPITGTIE